MANQILSGAVINAGMVIAGIDADNPPVSVGSGSSSGLVANKIFMWSSDNAGGESGTGRSDVGGVVMTDGDFSNPTTIQLESPQMVVGGEGKVVTIAQLGEIKVYDESTGQLEQTFNDSYLESRKASNVWDSANDAVIGAGKIFISSPEQNSNGVGSIIAVDLLDRNVATYLITPALGNYSRLSSTNWGGIRFIDGRIYGHTSQWSSADRGIWHFAPDGSDEQFIPVPEMVSGSGFAKWGDNFVVIKENAIEVIDSLGTPLHNVTKNYPSQTYTFGKDLGVTSTGKLVVLNKVHYNPEEYSIFLYDEGLTNEIEFKPTDIANGIASSWGYGTVENSGGFEVFGEYILVSAKEADNNGITNCGAVYRYNDSGVLQDIFYGTVADQRIGTNISVGTALPPVSVGSGSSSFVSYDWSSAALTLTLENTVNGNNYDFGRALAVSDDYYVVSQPSATQVAIFDTSGNLVQTITHPDGVSTSNFGRERSVHLIGNKLLLSDQSAPSSSGVNHVGKSWLFDVTDGSILHSFVPDLAVQGITFGQESAMSENYIAISDGLSEHLLSPSETKRVSIYDVSTGSLLRVITPNVWSANQLWNCSIDISGDRIAIGAGTREDTNNIRSGAVEVFDISTGNHVITVDNPNLFGTSYNDVYGKQVALSGNYLAASAPEEDSSLGNSRGVVYIHDVTDGSLLHTLYQNGDSHAFGRTLAITGKYLAVSDLLNSQYHGIVYVYDLTDGSLVCTVTNSEPQTYDFFGAALDILGEKLVIKSGKTGTAHVWISPEA